MKKNKAVICRLSGGLGNQLFMYAACRALCERSNSVLYIDTYSGFINDKHYKREFYLSYFNINYNKYYLLPFPFINKLLRKIKILLNKYKKLENRDYIFQKNISFDEKFSNLKINRTVTIEGYWQSNNYFSNIEKIIKEEFKIVNFNYSTKFYKWKYLILNEKSVCIHFRFYSEKNSNLDKSYYSKAINYLNINFNLSKIFIFTDNLNEFMHLYSDMFDNSFLVSADKLNPIEEFELMRLCKAHVIANSTFSWWAAWLSNSKLIISPNFKKFSGEGAWGFTGLIPEYFIEL